MYSPAMANRIMLWSLMLTAARCMISTRSDSKAWYENPISLTVRINDSAEVPIVWIPSIEDVRMVTRKFVADQNLDSTASENLESNLRVLRAKHAAEHTSIARDPASLPLLNGGHLLKRRAQLPDMVAAIAVFADHDSSVAISWNGRIQCVLELERLVGERYFCPPRHDYKLFRTVWLDALKVVRDRCECDSGNCPRYFEHGVVVNQDPQYGYSVMQWLPRIVEEVFIVENWHTVKHHEAHALIGFHASPFRKALIVSYDGGGSDGTFNAYIGSLGRVQRIAQLEYNMGGMYDSFAFYMPEVSGGSLDFVCGRSLEENFTGRVSQLSWAGKLMGYAGIGEERFEMRSAIRLLFESSWATKFGELPKLLMDAVCESIEGQRALAASVQAEFEEFSHSIVMALLQHVGAQNVEGIVLTGGCALNVQTNQRIHDWLSGSGTNHKKLGMYVPPAPNDCGLTVGALASVMPTLVRQPLQYIGFSLWDKGDLDSIARKRAAKKLSMLGGVEYLAELLTGGPAWLQEPNRTTDKPIVAVVRGRQEFGPRALGHRSLFAVADSLAMRERMNRLKFRQWYRPVAPIIAEEALSEVFGRVVESPYMTMAPRVRDDVLERFPALAHFDGTARHQSVAERDEPWVHALLLAVGRRAGLAALINTSLNTRGKPITNSIHECLKMLDELADLDFVVIEDWLFRKSTLARKNNVLDPSAWLAWPGAPPKE